MSLLYTLGNKVFDGKKSHKAREMRRRHPIRGYFGLNGSGKSWAMINDAIPDLELGRPCLSTVRLLDYKNPRECELTKETCDDWEGHNAKDMDGNHLGHGHPHPQFIPLTEWSQVLDFKGGPVLFDEITGIADSVTSELPAAVGNLFAQLRRENISLSYTALSYIRASKRIREATRLVNMCESMFPVDAVGPDGESLMWKQRQVSKIRSYDAKNLTGEVGDNFQEKLAQSRLVTGWHWIPNSPAALAYNTLAPVLHIGTVSDSGRCAYCGGNRRAPECSCSDYRERKSAAGGRRTASGGAARTARNPASDFDPVSVTTADHMDHAGHAPGADCVCVA